MDNRRQLRKDSSEKKKSGASITRRNLLKGLAGLPFVGSFLYALNKEQVLESRKNEILIKELGLEDISKVSQRNQTSVNKDLLKVGIIGYGSRAITLAKGLGYIHPDEVKRKSEATIHNWLEQEDLNVALIGICEVFDLRANKGLETARNTLHPGNRKHHDMPVKRYAHYHEMLNDKSIDAVIIATPDHWHAKMIIDAVKAGKHVYCEKCITRTDEELYEVYDVVKSSNIVFQLGHQITKNQVFQQAQKIINKNILGKISLVEATTNRNTARGAWIRHLDSNGNPLPGNEESIDWQQWLGSTKKIPFSTDRYYNWTKWFDYGTGMLGQLFSHEYDAVNQLLNIGIPKTALSSGGIYYWKDNREIPDVIQSVFEYPDKDLTLMYSGNLANSFQRGRVFMGHDATMDFAGTIKIKVDSDSTRYQKLIENGTIEVPKPILTLNPFGQEIDAVSSATENYYASRGLTYTWYNGKKVDVTHLHIKEWLDCIRDGGIPSANIDRSFDEEITIQMAHKSYLEKRMVKWDPVKRRII